MATVRFVNRTKNTVAAGSYVLLKRSRKEDLNYELPEDADIFAGVVDDVLPGAWGEAEDLTGTLP
jgi:hypothetical protein